MNDRMTPETNCHAGLILDANPSRTEQAILDALGDETLQAKGIARRRGHANNSYLRGVLAAMVRKGLLVHTADGYRRRAVPVPADGHAGPRVVMDPPEQAPAVLLPPTTAILAALGQIHAAWHAAPAEARVVEIVIRQPGRTLTLTFTEGTPGARPPYSSETSGKVSMRELYPASDGMRTDSGRPMCE